MSNMQRNFCSLVVEPYQPDFVIGIGKITLGETSRNNLQGNQKQQEKETLLQAACALLNSGGGLIRMEMKEEIQHPGEMGLDLEKALRELIQTLDLQTFFETRQHLKYFYIFVKSWSSGSLHGSPMARICSLSPSLYRRSGTSKWPMDSRAAFDFLKDKKEKAKHGLLNEGSSSNKIPRLAHQTISEPNSAFHVFQRDWLEFNETLPFPESQTIEFKQFSTRHIQEYVKSIIPEYISAFANTGGGYLFIGVDDRTKKVLGCSKDKVDPVSLNIVVQKEMSKLPIFHFCSSNAPISYSHKVINVLKMGELYGYVFVLKVEPFCCVVFSSAPNSWMVEEKKGIYPLTTEEWVRRMMDDDPDLPEAFESQLHLSESPPCCRPVYSRKGLEHKSDLQQHFFPVEPEHLRHAPEALWKELCKDHEGLEELIHQQLSPSSWGILIVSRSWAVDLNLQARQGVICDVLLIVHNNPPILFTVLREQETGGQDYCTHTAFTLKQKLVNMGGYTGRLCVLAKVLYLSPRSNAEPVEGSDSLINYPLSYNLADHQQMEALLQALVIVLLSFQCFLGDQLGSKVLNLLTAKQYEILSKNLHKSRELFIHGLPGSGKTVMAMKIMEKIRNVFHCESNKVLYICENQPLRDSISERKICQAVTRKTFMNYDFEEIEHIIIDEAQNFRSENGQWYLKAKNITQRKKDCPGILWIFLDYFQTSHLTDSGLPPFSAQYPREELNRVVRNADPIALYLQRTMQNIRENPPYNIPYESLQMLPEVEWVRGVSGSLKIEFLDLEAMVSYVTTKCKDFLKNGYSPKDIVVLFNTTDEMEKYQDKFLKEMRKRNTSQTNDAFINARHMFDSIRRFSGLERNIVFGISPWAATPAIYHSLLLCLASRANQHLYILNFLDRNPFIQDEIEVI
ncbi:schlafen family member 13-like [Perognathus longimembris pacificus]|uniref:schlafen family member 13-like n=1 Tax=Perognathus longimembris pacificus TaxID=214514 RepID=UPI00201969CF|nr:schlafen family member 13-like [Perognathus longimembris pacificus]